MEKTQNLEVLGGGTTNCGGGSCPTVYRDSAGRIYVQGNKMDSQLKKQTSIDNNEDIVELAPELLAVLQTV